MSAAPSPLTRRRFLQTTGIACSHLVFPGIVPALAKKQSIRLGYLPITDAAPLLVAHGLGYFSQEGLVVDRPVMVRSWKVLVESFLAGKFDITHMLFPIPVWMRFHRQMPVKVLAWDHTNGSAVTVRKDSNIYGFNDFGGKRIAVPSWYSMHNILIQMGLRARGLVPVIKPPAARLAKNEVNLFILSPPDMPTALFGKKIDGFIVADPFNALAQIKLNARIMRYTGDIWKNHPCCVIVAKEDFISTHRSAVQKAMNAIVRAQKWCLQNPVEAAHLISRDGEGYLPVQKQILHKVFQPPPKEQLQHPQWDVSRIGFQPFPFPSATRFIIEQMKQTTVEGNSDFLHALSPDQATDELVDNTFVIKAMDEIGGMAAFCNCEMTRPYEREEIVEVH